MQDQIASMGTNLLYISSGSVNKGGVRLGGGATKTLVTDDMNAILKEVPTVAEAAPGAGTSAQVVSDNQNWYTRVTGTTPQYFDIRNWPFSPGASFTPDDVTARPMWLCWALPCSKIFSAMPILWGRPFALERCRSRW